MLTRQRLRKVFNATAAKWVCWRCALISSRQSSSLESKTFSEYFSLEVKTFKQALEATPNPTVTSTEKKKAKSFRFRKCFATPSQRQSSFIRPSVLPKTNFGIQASESIPKNNTVTPTERKKEQSVSFRKSRMFRRIRKHNAKFKIRAIESIPKNPTVTETERKKEQPLSFRRSRMFRPSRNYIVGPLQYQPSFAIPAIRTKANVRIRFMSEGDPNQTTREKSLRNSRKLRKKPLSEVSTSIGSSISRTEMSNQSDLWHEPDLDVHDSAYINRQLDVNRESRDFKTPSFQIRRTNDLPKRSNSQGEENLDRNTGLNLGLDKSKGKFKDFELPNWIRFFKSRDSSTAALATKARSSWSPDVVSRQKSSLAHPSKNIARSYNTSAKKTSPNEIGVQNPINSQSGDFSKQVGEIPVREHLRIWQEQQNINIGRADVPMNDIFNFGGAQNLITQGGENDMLRFNDQDDEHFESLSESSLRLERDLVDTSSDSLFFTRGDMVEIKIDGGEPILAVFVNFSGIQSRFYTIRGRWESRKNTSITFAVPKMFLPSDIDPIVPYLPKEQMSVGDIGESQDTDPSVPREIGANIIEKMLQFYQQTDDIIRMHADSLNNAFNLIAHPTEVSTATIQDIAIKIFPKKHPSDLTATMLWAIHRVVLRTELFFIKNAHDRTSPDFFVMSKQDARDAEDVTRWMREYQEDKIANVTGTLGTKALPVDKWRCLNPIPAFISKARKLIQKSRKVRDVTESGVIGPDSSKLNAKELRTNGEARSIAFTYCERKILDFLLRWTATPFVNLQSNLSSVGPTLLRAIGMYNHSDLGKSQGYMLLQELGCIAPWNSRVAFNPKLRVLGQKYQFGLSRLKEQADSSLSSLVMKDDMKALRKDWGDLAVFCIDSAETKERDDGISLEEIEGDPSTFWVHVHIANPSAFLSPDSKMSLYAKEVVSSVYFPERAYPMLPAEISQARFSIQRGGPCITFSAKVTTEGDITQSEITHGVLHNVKYMTPDALHRELGLEKTNRLQNIRLTVGRDDKSALAQEDYSQVLSPSDVKQLQKLRDMTVKRGARRERKGALLSQISPDVDVGAIFPPSVQNNNHLVIKPSRGFKGDPIISLTNTCPIINGQSSRKLINTMIGDIMILAGEIAASWCRQRNIPIVFRGTFRNTETAASAERFRKHVLDPVFKEIGQYTPWITGRYTALLGRTTSSVSPLEHVPIGVPEYCKTTSPLRRYSDLLTHWQIEAAIRHESETGVSLIGNTNNNYLPFSRAKLEAMMPQLRDREETIAGNQKLSEAHWSTLLMLRASQFKEAPLPETFQVFINSSARCLRQRLSKGWLSELGLVCFLPENDATAREGSIDSGDLWEARIYNIDVHWRLIKMEPIRLISRGAPQLSDANTLKWDAGGVGT